MSGPITLAHFPLAAGDWRFDYEYGPEGLFLLATDGFKVYREEFREEPDIHGFFERAQAEIKKQWKRGALPPRKL